jgi:subfamily B ATP-binding cassette protein MsbA
MTKHTTIIAALPKESTFKLMKRLVKEYLRPYTGTIGVALFFMLLDAATTAGIAKLIQPILDDVLGAKNTSMIWPVAGLVLLTFGVRGFSTYYHTVLMNRVSQSILADIQRKQFSHFMNLDLAFYHSNPSGQLISRVVNDVNVMRIAVSDTMTGLGKSLLTLIFLLVVMFLQDWKLSLIALCIFPLATFFVVRLGQRLRRVSKSIQSELGNLSDRLSQIFQGIRQVQAYGMENYERERMGGMIERVKNLNIKSVRVATLSTPVNEVLVGLVFFSIIVYGGYQAAAGTMSAGQLASFLAAFTMAYEPMKKLAKLNNTMQIGLGAAERVFQILDQDPVVRDAPDGKVLTTDHPSIEFKAVAFRYEGSDLRAIDGISFVAPSDKVTALVGPSGGGKSTVINLIPRFYDVLGGQVLIDGQDIRSVTLESLRNHIALVSQDITIFDDTIGANIGYGRAGATQAEIEAAAKAAAAHDFISAFPEGYNTAVGEDGVKLSGGQRQRISIARAILRNAPILLLDEATSALDNESEKLVQDALEKLQKGRTTLVIAHRLTTVRNADLILVMDRGQIVESGQHSTLIEQKGLYARMYETGLKDAV